MSTAILKPFQTDVTVALPVLHTTARTSADAGHITENAQISAEHLKRNAIFGMPSIINTMAEGDKKKSLPQTANSKTNKNMLYLYDNRKRGKKQVDINEVTMLLPDIGFGKSSGRTLLAEACLLYAKGTHKLQDITERIGETHGISSKQVYHRVWKVIQLAWNSPFRSPRMMYDTRVTKVCPSVKKFIKLFVEQKMGERS